MPGLTKYESSGWERFFGNEAANRPEADDVVAFIVVIDEKSQPELYSVNEITSQTASAQSHAKKQETVLNAVKNRVKDTFGREDGFKRGFTYIIATTEWDDSVGEWGDYVIKATLIGTTSFVNYPGYGGANIIQSMDYDHNTGRMYWFAHSQVAKWEEIPVTFRSAIATLEGNIGLNFYVKLSSEMTADPSTAMQFAVNGRIVTVPMSEAVISVCDGVSYHRFTCTLNAKQMADTVVAQIVTSEGPVGGAVTYSVKQYCMNMIRKSADQTDLDLYKAMLNYGAACQVLFGYNTDNLANADLDEAERLLRLCRRIFCTEEENICFFGENRLTREGNRRIIYSVLLCASLLLPGGVYGK